MCDVLNDLRFDIVSGICGLGSREVAYCNNHVSLLHDHEIQIVFISGMSLYLDSLNLCELSELKYCTIQACLMLYCTLQILFFFF